METSEIIRKKKIFTPERISYGFIFYKLYFAYTSHIEKVVNISKIHNFSCSKLSLQLHLTFSDF